MAQLHRQGVSRPYVAQEGDRVALRALVRRRAVLEKPPEARLSELEALLARHWPELLLDMDVWCAKTPLELLAEHGAPADVTSREEVARQVMRRASCNGMKDGEVERILESARRSTDVLALDEERDVVRAAPAEALHVRASISSIDKMIEKRAVEHEATRSLAPVVGRVTAVVPVAYLGPLSTYASAAALEKACGLSSKVESNGNSVGRPSITKRGSSVVRRYLFLAALRLVKNDAVVGAWYRARVGHRADRKLIALVAVERQRVRALWHVAREEGSTRRSSSTCAR